MGAKIQIQKEELYPANPSLESDRRNPSGSTVTRWRSLKYDYSSTDLAISAVDHMVSDDDAARVIDEDGKTVWERQGTE